MVARCSGLLKKDGMMLRPEPTQTHEFMQLPPSSSQQVQNMRRKLQDNLYMQDAIQGLARELTIEIMESTYGIPFR